MAFLKEPQPAHAVSLPVLPGISRVVAANPSVMTYHGTNTWLIEGDDGFTVIDPGPDDKVHVGVVLKATGNRIARILLTHTHVDHVGATAALQAASRAPTFGFRISEKASFVADHLLDEGDEVAGMVALHTPGHALDHLCYARPDGVLFTGDHVMAWNSSIVSPPNGDMAKYFASLQRLLDRDDKVYLPGHGPKLTDPRPFVAALLSHRVKREKEIAASLSEQPITTGELTSLLYSQTHKMLRIAAERNVLAHLLKLEHEGVASRHGDMWRLATPG